MKEYHGARIAGREELDGVDFPSEVQLAIDDLAGSMREGLLALSVGVGHKVMNELMEEERTQLVGPKGKNDRARGPKRHGSRRAQVVLGGRKVPARRPRPRTANGEEELKLRTFSHFASEDLLQEQTVERVLAGLSTRRYRAASSPPPPRTARCRARRCRGAS